MGYKGLLKNVIRWSSDVAEQLFEGGRATCRAEGVFLCLVFEG